MNSSRLIARRLIAAAILVALAIAGAACRGTLSGRPQIATPDAANLVPFLEPDANHQPVLGAIQDAKNSIRLEMYLLTDKDVMEALKKARARGVDVRVLIEDQPIGVGTGNKPAISELRAANIAVQNGNPAYKLTHAKFMVVDERVALLMSFDHTRASFTLNRGFGIIDEDPQDVNEMVKVFEADWTGSNAQMTSPNLIWGPAESRTRLTEFIDAAKRTLDMEVSTIRDDDIEQHIVSARQRGVSVRIIVSPAVAGPDPNAPSVKKLATAGVKMRTLKNPYIASNMMVADAERGYVGSHEFSKLSLDTSRELGMLVTLKRIVDGLQATFAADWDIAR